MDSVGEMLDDAKKSMDSVGEVLGDPKKPMKSIGEMLGDPKKPIYSVGETLGHPKKPMKSIGEMLGDPKKPINSVGETLDDPKKPMNSVGEMLDDPKKPMNSVGEMLGDPKKPIYSSTAVAKNMKPAMHKSTCTYQPTVRYRARRRSLDSNEIASTTLMQNCSKGNRSAIERRVSDVREKSKEILSAKKKLRINRTAQSPIYIDLESGTNSKSCRSTVTSTSAVPDRSKQSQTLPKTGESLFKKKRPRIDGTQQDPIGITLQCGTNAKDFVSSIQTVYVLDSSAVPILSEKSKAPPKTGKKSLSAKKRPRMDGTEQNSIDTEQQNGTKTTILAPTSETKYLPSTSTVPVISEQSQQPAESGKSLPAKKRPRLDGTKQKPFDTEQQNWTRTTYGPSAEAKSMPSTDAVAGISEQSQLPPKSGELLLLGVPIDQLNEELINHRIMNDGFKIEFSCPFDFENGHLLPTKWYWRVRPDKKIESRTTQTDFDDTAYRVISRILPRPDRAEKALKSGLIENGKNKISRQIQTDEVPMSCHTCAPDLSLPHTGIDKSCPTCRSKTVSSCSTQTAINGRSDPTCSDRTFQMDGNVDDESYTTGTEKPSWACPMELTDTENSCPHSFTDKLRSFSTQTDEDNSLCEIGTLENIKSTGNHSQCCLAENGDISLCHNCVFSKGEEFF
eukprot:Seg3418.1 transcript_id=Seg3418.1/GoldUCD/mRNA.D3Y31 product="hypothetical protein" protein_id=Seg3418.1/GoldUCD/D3Y31